MKWLESGLTLGILLTLVASWTLWTAGLLRVRRGAPLLPPEPRRDVPWGALEIGFILGPLLSLAVLSIVNAAWTLAETEAGEPLTIDSLLARLAVSSLISLTVLAVTGLVVRLRAGANWQDLGISLRRAPYDIALGLAAFFMLAPAVFLIMLVLVRWFPSEHPIVKLVKEHPDARIFALSFLSAVVVAPLVEEFLFRVFLQGWLEKVARSWARKPAHNEASGASPDQTSGLRPAGEGPGDPNPYAPPLADLHDAPMAAELATSEAPAVRPPPFWPVLVSSAIFALMHWGHGPDPIPLFVLSLGLGYLYRQTHRVLPGMVVHMALNGVSMVQLLLVVYMGAE